MAWCEELISSSFSGLDDQEFNALSAIFSEKPFQAVNIAFTATNYANRISVVEFMLCLPYAGCVDYVN